MAGAEDTAGPSNEAAAKEDGNSDDGSEDLEAESSGSDEEEIEEEEEEGDGEGDVDEEMDMGEEGGERAANGTTGDGHAVEQNHKEEVMAH